MPAVRTSLGFRPFVLFLTTVATSAAVAFPLFSADLRPDYRPAAYAIKGAKIVVKPGTTIDTGTVVVRNGLIDLVGKVDEVEIPYDAETIDGKDLVVYPGFIDLYTTLGQPSSAARSQTGSGRNVPYSDFALAHTPLDNRSGLTPEFEVAPVLELADSLAEERRKLGFSDLLSAPGGSIATGQSALVSLSGLPRREAVVHGPVGLHINLSPPFDPLRAPIPDEPPAVARRRMTNLGSPAYPRSLMGVIAHLRQAMLDAEYHHELRAYFAQTKGSLSLPFDPALEALYAAKTGQIPVWWEANTRDEILRVLDLSEEFGTRSVIVGGREAGKVADRLKASNIAVVLRLDFPDEPKVPTEAEYRQRDPSERTDSLRLLADRAARWKARVATAKALASAGVRFAFSTDGIAKVDTFHVQVRKAIAAGLSREAAVAALTQNAAEIADVGTRIGTIEPGKLGHIVALTAPYGDENAKVRYVLADGIKFDMSASTQAAGTAKEKKTAQKPDEAKPKEEKEKPKPEAEKGKTEPAAARPPKSDENQPPKAEAPKDQPEPKPETTKAKTDAETAKDRTEPAKAAVPNGNTAARMHQDKPPAPFVDVATELDADRKPTIHTGGNVLIKNATILTVAPPGTIPKGSILVIGGKIKAVGADIGNVPVPDDVKLTVIDAGGLVAMPGIIDTHSHIAIDGSVNETSLSVVPEVRVRDVVTGDDRAIYRALAGGTTTARLLHGSSDTIGGQDAVIKLRYGQPGRDLIVHDGSQGVKFALGENVTRRIGRFPNTRMGVEAVIERAFEEARDYQARRMAYKDAKAKGNAPPPFRRDLRLEALAGILDGSIKIHSHCYRSDEILMLLRVSAQFGVRVQSLQHVLEGYKVAAEIAAHGASASTFSDWWAYKVEAYDAIPFNSALLVEAGVKVCIKSDDRGLMRHLYLEAAKMMKYGGVTEAQALEMITLNPAQQLGLEDRIGSIEVGKDADIALFNAHPFDAFARCEMTLIDGEVWFDRTEPEGHPTPRPGDHSTAPLASAELRAKELEIPANPKGVYALIGATLHPVSGPDITNGTLIVAEGQILALGGPDTPVPSGAQSIDLNGLDVWPGLVEAGNVLGLFEVGSLSETQDYADSAQFEPELRTSVALHPDSDLIPVTRANGVLTSYVHPTGGIIAGQGCVIELTGWVPSEMVLADRVALNVTIPAQISTDPERRTRFQRPGGSTGETGDPQLQRRQRIEAIKEQFRLALLYNKVITEAQAHKSDPPVPDPRMEALAPYAKGEKPVIFQANKSGEILDALKIAKELKLKAIISGGSEAWKVADALKAANVPVIVAGTLPYSIEETDPYDAMYANPAKLHDASVTFAIRSGGRAPDPATAARNLPYEAATAVAYGLPEAEALKAVTLTPAQLLGIADRVGSLETGKRADLVITAGHILQPTTVVKHVFIGGKPLTPESRHTYLYAKYRQRLAEVKAGTARLGIELKPTILASPAAPMPAAAPASPIPSSANQR